MPQQTEFTKFVALIDIDESNAQNVQEMASIWGDIRREFEEIGASIEESYALLGEYDFLVTFEAPAVGTAFEADIVLERHGLSVQTMEMVDTEEFSELVRDA